VAFCSHWTGLVLAWIEADHGAPLLGAHVVGQDQALTEELDGTGGSNAGDTDQAIEDRLQVLMGADQVEGVCRRKCSICVSKWAMLWYRLRLAMRKSGVIAVDWAAWSWFLV